MQPGVNVALHLTGSEPQEPNAGIRLSPFELNQPRLFSSGVPGEMQDELCSPAPGEQGDERLSCQCLLLLVLSKDLKLGLKHNLL